MSQSIIGPLVNWDDQQWHEALAWITHDNGKKYKSVQDLRRAFCEELKNGHICVPLASDCDNFDYENGGCRGHDVPESEIP